MQKILIATTNHGKYKELMEVLGDLPFKFVTLTDENAAEYLEETGNTYEANAILKAEFFGRKTGLPAIADDSGILVEALKGDLGVHTRRWGAGENATDEEWLDYFLNRLKTETNRNAIFVSVVALYWPGQKTMTFRGECIGTIMDKPQIKVEPGIPLSAVFLPNGKDKVFSALDKHEKNEISHRGIAIKKCYQYIFKHKI